MNENLVGRIGERELYLMEGSITQIPTDAIMTVTNSYSKMYEGRIDKAIREVAGNHYHEQVWSVTPLSDLQTIVAKGDASKHKGKFDDVVFVVDDWHSPLDNVVYAGLEAALQEGYDRLLIPAIRTGAASDMVEKTPEEKISRLGLGIINFMLDHRKRTELKNLVFVVYGDPATSNQFATEFLKVWPQ